MDPQVVWAGAGPGAGLVLEAGVGAGWRGSEKPSLELGLLLQPDPTLERCSPSILRGLVGCADSRG